MRRLALAVVAGSVASISLVGTALTDDSKKISYVVGDKRSGYTYAQPETQAMQDDDFENPAMLWVEQGEAAWSTAEGDAGKSCADCHGDASESMADVGTRYPVYYKPWGKMMNLEQRINNCRKENMKAKPWKYESRELLSMTAYVRHQSWGKPMNVKIDGPAAPFYEKGKEFYYQRRGQLDMACKNCHVDNAGKMLRANLLSQGQPNGFPTYRLKWQGVGSLHRRFRGCNKQVRAQPYASGSDEYVNLELFLAARAKGLPVETPSVRN
jgi:sulfur-oxidizing protein SoxA